MDGKIIVIEGIDGCGKQTQAELLYKKLKKANKKVMEFSFPNYKSSSSAPVKLYLEGHLSNTANGLDAYQSSVLFAVDRLCSYKQEIEKYYHDGYTIILDRYVTSNMLHQASKIEDKTDLENYLIWLDELEYNSLKLPRPDAVIFLDVPPKTSINLAKNRKELKSGTIKDIHEQDEKHLIKAYNSGKEIATKLKWDIINCFDDNKNLLGVEIINKRILLKLKKQ